jgi:hypothetical protein
MESARMTRFNTVNDCWNVLDSDMSWNVRDIGLDTGLAVPLLPYIRNSCKNCVSLVHGKNCLNKHTQLRRGQISPEVAF